MALEELDGLFNDLASDADKTAMRDILTRSQKAADRLTQRETVYTAFVDGDTAALARVTAPPVVVAPVVSTPTSVDLADLDRRLDERMGSVFEDPRLKTVITAEATALAEKMVKAAEERAVGRALKGGAEITTILHNHRVTYGKELDQAAYEKFVIDNSGKFISLTAAYEAFTEADGSRELEDDALKRGQADTRHNRSSWHNASRCRNSRRNVHEGEPDEYRRAGARGDALDAAASRIPHLSARGPCSS